MGLDISIKCQTVPEAMKYLQPDEDELSIQINGRMTFGQLVHQMGYTDDDYGKDKPITNEQALMAVEYLYGCWHKTEACKLALWIVLGADITFEADW